MYEYVTLPGWLSYNMKYGSSENKTADYFGGVSYNYLLVEFLMEANSFSGECEHQSKQRSV